MYKKKKFKNDKGKTENVNYETYNCKEDQTNSNYFEMESFSIYSLQKVIQNM